MDLIEGIIIVNSISELLNSSSESSGDKDDDILFLLKDRYKTCKAIDYFSTIVTYTDDMFKSHFRLCRSSIEELVHEIKTPYVIVKGTDPVPILKALLTTVWLIANQESYRSIGDRFGFSKGHCHSIVLRTCKLIYRKRHIWIKWPLQEAAVKCIQEFNNLRGENGFPNVLGCLDGTHIIIPQPKNYDAYYTRKGVHALQAQLICNSNYEIIDVFLGWPGSCHDARVWRNSPIKREIEIHPEMIPHGCYLLADTAYPLSNAVMVGFKDNGHLSQMQKIFNKKLSSTRIVIEQAIGRLKGKFRRLKYFHITKLANAKYYIMLACILHNISLKEGFDYENSDDDELDADDVGVDIHERNPEAERRRNDIMNLICN